MPNIDLNITVRKLIEEFKNMQAGWTPYEIPEEEGEAFLQKTEEMCSEIKSLFESLDKTDLLRPKSSTWKESTLTLRSTALYFAEEMESMIKLFATIYNNKGPEDGQRHNDLPDAVAWVKNLDPALMVPGPRSPNPSETDISNLFMALVRSSDRGDDGDGTNFHNLSSACLRWPAEDRNTDKIQGEQEEDENTDKMIMEFNQKATELKSRVTDEIMPLYRQLISGIISHVTTITDDLMPGALKLTEIIELITGSFPSTQHYEMYEKRMSKLRLPESIYSTMDNPQSSRITICRLFDLATSIDIDTIPHNIGQSLERQIETQKAKCQLIRRSGKYAEKKAGLFSEIRITTCDHDREPCARVARVVIAPDSNTPQSRYQLVEQWQETKQELEKCRRKIAASEGSLQRHRARLLKELAENMNQMNNRISELQREAYPLSLQLTEIDETSKQELQELRHHIELSTTRLAENMKEMEQLTTELIEEPFRQSLRLTEIGVTREAIGQLVEQFTARHTEIPSKLKEIARTGEESSTQASLQEWQDEIKQSVEQFIEQFRDQLLEHAEAATEEQGSVAATTMNVGDVEQHQQTTEQQSDPHPTLIHSGFVIR